MQFLKSWVRSIAVMSVIAGAVQLILPSGSVQRYVRLVVGLAIVLQVLTPLAGAVQVGLRGTTGNQGAWFSQADWENLDKAYRQQLEWQVESIAMAVPGVESAKARVELEHVTLGLPKIGRMVVEVRLRGTKTGRETLLSPDGLSQWLAERMGIEQSRVTVTLTN